MVIEEKRSVFVIAMEGKIKATPFNNTVDENEVNFAKAF